MATRINESILIRLTELARMTKITPVVYKKRQKQATRHPHVHLLMTLAATLLTLFFSVLDTKTQNSMALPAFLKQ